MVSVSNSHLVRCVGIERTFMYLQNAHFVKKPLTLHYAGVFKYIKCNSIV